MNFDEWMHRNGLSKASAAKYSGALRGTLSRMAIEANITTKSLGLVNSHAEFAQIVKALTALPVFGETDLRGHTMYRNALVQFGNYLAECGTSALEQELVSILDDGALPVTEKKSLLLARVGQGVFRQRVTGIWKACSVTGYDDVSFLIASHIKPWRESSNAERLDPFNGLLLLPNLDKAFDRGLISFLPQGAILISPLLAEPERLGVFEDMRISTRSEHEPYLQFHRDFVFQST